MGTSFNNDIATGCVIGALAPGGAPFAYQYNANITMNCIFAIAQASSFLNFNFTSGVDQNYLQNNVIIDYIGGFQVVKLI